MYTFKPHTERIERLRSRVRDRLIIADAEKELIKQEAVRKYRDFPPMLEKPYESLYVIERMPIDIDEDEFFVGGMGFKNWVIPTVCSGSCATSKTHGPSRRTAFTTPPMTTPSIHIRSLQFLPRI